MDLDDFVLKSTINPATVCFDVSICGDRHLSYAMSYSCWSCQRLLGYRLIKDCVFVSTASFSLTSEQLTDT